MIFIKLISAAAAANTPPLPSTGGLVYKMAWEIEDEKSNLTDNQRTMGEFQAMANTLIHFIQVTSDRQDDHEEKTLPVLDLQCWVEGGVVLHCFYQKPMGSPFCLMEASAMGANTKWATLSQEVIRRMKNTSQRVCGTIRSEILTDFMRKLQRSGHPEEFRKNCLVAALKGYSRMVKNEEEGLGPVNRQRGTRPNRQKKLLGKLREKGSWYKRPTGPAIDPGKPATLGYRGKQPPVSHFTRKSANKSDKAVVCPLPRLLSQKMIGSMRQSCLFCTHPMVPWPLRSGRMIRKEEDTDREAGWY